MFSTFVSSAWLFTLRLIALYRRNRYLVWFMYAFFFATYAASFGTLTAALVTYHKTVAYFEILNACGATEASHTFPALFYAPAAYEVFIFALTAWRAYQDASLISGAPFMRVLYRDGVIAFLVMTGVRGWNIWIYVSQPITALSIGTNIMWALNTILMTRVYLNLQWLAKGPTLGGYHRPDDFCVATWSWDRRAPHPTQKLDPFSCSASYHNVWSNHRHDADNLFDLGTEPHRCGAQFTVELRTVKEDEDVPHSLGMMAETLRLKCDRVVPCNSCVRRGCPQICPDGTLTPGKGSRFILNNTKELHEEIEALRTRVRQLEGALAELQAQLTPEPHPLLQKSLNMVSTALGPAESHSGKENSEAEDESLIDTFGRLNLEPNGQTIWYGPQAGSRFYIPRDESEENAVSALPVDLMVLSRLFPLGATTISEAEDIVRQQVKRYIPPEKEVTESIYSHHSNLNWSAEDVPPKWARFRETTIKPIYSPGSQPTDAQLAVFFLEYAVSLILDPRRQPDYAEADRYHHLSKICISLGKDLLISCTLEVIGYLLYKRWITGSLAIRLAEMGGLHRENPRWNLDSEIIERRRRTWWELVSLDTVRSLELGRRRAINVDHFDTKMPHDPEDEGGEPTCAVLVRMLYADLQTVSRVRFKYMAASLGAILDESVSSQACLTYAKLFRLVYLHRRYFIEALTRYPHEPLRSKYAISVIAVYRSSILILQALKGRVGGWCTAPQVFTMGQHGLPTILMELYMKGEWSSNVGTVSDQDVLTFAGRPGVLSVKARTKQDSTSTSTPDSNAPESSITNAAHPLLLEYLMRIQDAQTTQISLISRAQWPTGQAPAEDLSFALPNPISALSSGESVDASANASIWPYVNYEVPTTSPQQQPSGDNFWQMFLSDLDMMPFGSDGHVNGFISYQL
ncbi:SubName: Full=Uncharacterized protein {ECO:0000313/EMBL:CCA77721.1}, partial [Serendipita indica DSM 11827]